MFFKREVVKVLESGPFLTKIQDAEGHEFWVKNADLKSDLKPAPARVERKVKIQNRYAEHTNFLDFLRANATIRVQLPPQSVPNFQKNYRRVTGEDVDAPSEHVSIIPPESKWGTAITVLFPAAGKSLVPASLEIFSYAQASPDVLGICNKDFAWELFSLGFRIGHGGTKNDEQQR